MNTYYFTSSSFIVNNDNFTEYSLKILLHHWLYDCFCLNYNKKKIFFCPVKGAARPRTKQEKPENTDLLQGFKKVTVNKMQMRLHSKYTNQQNENCAVEILSRQLPWHKLTVLSRKNAFF